jgi:hypothetical protein
MLGRFRISTRRMRVMFLEDDVAKEEDGGAVLAYRAIVRDIADNCRGSIAGFRDREGGAIEAVVANTHADNAVMKSASWTLGYYLQPLFITPT